MARMITNKESLRVLRGFLSSLRDLHAPAVHPPLPRIAITPAPLYHLFPRIDSLERKGTNVPSAAPCAIVIFGASGDLAERKLIPAIYELAHEKLLDERSYLVGFARSEMSDEQFRAECREGVTKFARTKPIDEATWKKLEERIYYAQ